MSIRPVHLRMTMDADARLAAAAGGAARSFADAAGLADSAILALQASVLSACNHCFKLHTSSTPCAIQVHRWGDRIEVELVLPGEDAPLEGDTLSWPGIDEVRRERHSSEAVLRLIKFIPAAPEAG